MKKILLFSMLFIATFTAFGQRNSERHVHDFYGGITVGGTYKSVQNVTISPIVEISGQLAFIKKGTTDTLPPYVPLAQRVNIGSLAPLLVDSTITYVTPTQLNLAVAGVGGDEDAVVDAIRDFGSPLIGVSIPLIANASKSMSDGRAYYQLVRAVVTDTVNHINFVQAVQGDYTADNNNYAAIYTESGGTLTQVAISANNGNLWKAAANAIVTVDLTTGYVVTAGQEYVVAWCYNSSAQTTGPSLAGSDNVAALLNYGMTNSKGVMGYTVSTTELPASIASSSLTKSHYVFAVTLVE